MPWRGRARLGLPALAAVADEAGSGALRRSRALVQSGTADAPPQGGQASSGDRSPSLTVCIERQRVTDGDTDAAERLCHVATRTKPEDL